MEEQVTVRASGRTTAEEVGQELAEEMHEELEEAVLDTERVRTFEDLGFARIRTEWSEGERDVLRRIDRMVRARIHAEFLDAFVLMEDIYKLVRKPLYVDPRTGEYTTEELGELVRDRFGEIQYERYQEGGRCVEDWSRLAGRAVQGFLYRLGTGLFGWEQSAARLKAQAMYGKAAWVERFAIKFGEGHGTVDARTAHGNRESADERNFATVLAQISWESEALVRSLKNLIKVLDYATR